MRMIDLNTWSRREHFEVYRHFDHPHFSLCANVDLTAFVPALKERGASFTVAIVYVIARAANAIPEFRYRMRGEGVVEHEVVHPSTTILAEGEVFSFCMIEYREDFTEFAALAAERIAAVRARPVLHDAPGQDDLLFMTAIPWVSFTSFTHPTHLNPADSVPRFAWGKYFEEGGRLMLPLGAQVHHALMDGLHVGKFYAEVQEYMSKPDSILG
jgi:chloramphenicol O-acetyltransferase type A